MHSIAAIMPAPSSRKLIMVLTAVATIIIAVHVGTLIARYAFDRDHVFGLTNMFDVDMERNVPAMFSFSLLMIAAVLLAVIARRQPAGTRPRAALWAGLGAAFFYLACDEGFELHERVGAFVADALGGGKLTHYAWLIPYGIGALVFGIIYARFLRQLPRDTRIQFLIAGTIFVGGAFATEFFAGIYVYYRGTEQTLGYDLLSALEESLEMAGVIWFIHALVHHLQKNSAPTPERRGAVVQPCSSDPTST